MQYRRYLFFHVKIKRVLFGRNCHTSLGELGSLIFFLLNSPHFLLYLCPLYKIYNLYDFNILCIYLNWLVHILDVILFYSWSFKPCKMFTAHWAKEHIVICCCLIQFCCIKEQFSILGWNTFTPISFVWKKFICFAVSLQIWYSVAGLRHSRGWERGLVLSITLLFLCLCQWGCSEPQSHKPMRSSSSSSPYFVIGLTPSLLLRCLRILSAFFDQYLICFFRLLSRACCWLAKCHDIAGFANCFPCRPQGKKNMVVITQVLLRCNIFPQLRWSSLCECIHRSFLFLKCWREGFGQSWTLSCAPHLPGQWMWLGI